MSHEAAAGHDDHAHHPFLAHHFDDTEQQYDSGKLGIWIFLVTEVLFFSGMFCAYALYRNRNPEIFMFASQFLNETLGAFNTGVLLFSSLSMAWAVRCAQVRQRTGLIVMLAITLGCASMFLGVKAVEYTHKWDIGLLTAGYYESQYAQTVHHAGISSWLYVLSAVPAICVVGFLGWYGLAVAQRKVQQVQIAGPLLVTALCYFAGVGIGVAFQNAEEAAKHAEHPAAHAGGEQHDEHGAAHDDHAHDDHADGEEAGHDAAHSSTAMVVKPGSAVSDGGQLADVSSEKSPVVPGEAPIESIDQKAGAGLFFSIYYCMTGVHAVHILGGMAVLAWLLVRATKNHFDEEYFGPVDYVGLYWHLVDLIWIYLFPLLYLIK